MAKINKTRYAILGVLSLMPASGYDIKKFCDKGIAHFWNENFGHIYPVLKRLEEQELIKKETEVRDGKPAKNVYSITEKGKEELIEWLMQPVENSPARLELLLKLTFAKNVAPESMLDELKRIEGKHIRRMEELKHIEKEFSENNSVKADEGFPYWLATIRYGIYDAEFRIKWCQETIKSICEWNKMI